MIKLNTPMGAVYIRREAITAVSATNGQGQNDTIVNSNVWVLGQEEPFNVLEDAETVYNLMRK